MATAHTAAEYAERYLRAFETGALTQGAFHTERDGRQLACALGVIGDDVDDPSKCPATIMPRWLARMVPALFDKQRQDDAFAWGLAFTDALKRLDGKVPFSVVHHWHAHTVCQLGIDAAIKRKRDPAPHKALQALHLRAMAGETISADEWRPVLENAYADAYVDAYAYANAYVDAYANANANAYANANAWKLLADGMVAALNASATS